MKKIIIATLLILSLYPCAKAQISLDIETGLQLSQSDTISHAEYVVVQKGDNSWAIYPMSEEYETPDLISPNYRTDLVDHGANYLPVHIYVQNDRVYLDGTLKKTTGNINNEEYLFLLPSTLRPSQNKIVFAQQRSTPIQLYILSNGQVQVIKDSSASWLSLDGVSYYLD